MTDAVQIVLARRPTGDVTADCFRAGDRHPAGAGRRPGAGALALPVARSLHAAAHDRAALLHAALRARQAADRRLGRRGGRIEATRASPRATRDGHAELGDATRSMTARACARSTRRSRRCRPISACSACRPSPPGTASPTSASPRPARRCSSRPRPAPSARWRASSPSSPAPASWAAPATTRSAHWAVREAGYDACFNHRTERDYRRGARQALPAGHRCRLRECRRQDLPRRVRAAEQFRPRRLLRRHLRIPGRRRRWPARPRCSPSCSAASPSRASSSPTTSP